MEYCEITMDTLAVRLEYRLEQDLEKNRSLVHITGLQMKTLNGFERGSLWIVGNIYLNGTRAVNMFVTNTAACNIYLYGEFSGGTERDWGGFNSVDVTLPHNADGTLNVPVRLELGFYTTSSAWAGTENGDGEMPLPRIPRVTGIAASGVALGSAMTITLTRAAADFRDTVSWQCGSRSGVVVSKTANKSVQWTPALTLANEAPNGTSVSVKLTVTSYLGDTAIGSTDVTVRCTIPADVLPAAEVTVSDPQGYAAQYGSYIQGESRARVRTAATGIYGSTIRSIQVTCCGLTAGGDDVTFALPDSGVFSVTVRVTDSRGRKCEIVQQITVRAYARPQITIRSAFRCDAGGSAQSDGSYAKLVFDIRCTAVPGGSVSYQAIRRLRGGTASATVELTEYADQLTVTGGSVILPVGIDSAYDCIIRARDSFCTADVSALIPVAFALLDLHRASRSVGIGMRAGNTGKLSIGLDMDLSDHRLSSLADPTAAQDAATKAYVDRKIRELAEALGI